MGFVGGGGGGGGGGNNNMYSIILIVTAITNFSSCLYFIVLVTANTGGVPQQVGSQAGSEDVEGGLINNASVSILSEIKTY